MSVLDVAANVLPPAAAVEPRSGMGMLSLATADPRSSRGDGRTAVGVAPGVGLGVARGVPRGVIPGTSGLGDGLGVGWE